AANDFLVDAVDLEVELNAGDAPDRAGDLEVHVAEVVLIAHDVGQQDEAVFLLDQADGDACHRIADRHAGVHERQSAAADAGHAAGTVGFKNIGDNSDRVRELVGTGDDRLETALSQGAVADLAPPGAADRTALADAEGRKIVVQHEFLAVLV